MFRGMEPQEGEARLTNLRVRCRMRKVAGFTPAIDLEGSVEPLHFFDFQSTRTLKICQGLSAKS